ncbi:MAG: glutathione S-transferase [Flavobacteriales bacterium]|jgi:glutathione S-transferase
MKLYQFPISHYCEKARWAIQYKRLPYKRKTLLPGLHRKPMLRLSGQSSLPVLKDEKAIVSGSSEIVSYLDATYPRFQLTPEDATLAARSLKWEAMADEKVGPSVRKIIYSVLLDHPNIVIPLFIYEGPFYSNFVLKRSFPKIQEALRRGLPITDESVSETVAELKAVISEMRNNMDSEHYIVGDKFSRADLAFASLLAPLFRPGKYGGESPSYYPEKLENIIAEFDEVKPWVMEIYSRHR